MAASKIFVLIVIIASWGIATPSPGNSEVEDKARHAIAQLAAHKYELVAEQFHYPPTMTEQARSHDREVMIRALRSIFGDMNGLSNASVDSVGNDEDMGRAMTVLGVYAGDESDWSAEVTRYPISQVQYRVLLTRDSSLIVSCRYIRPFQNWELLDILLFAPRFDAKAVSRLRVLQGRVLDILRLEGKHAGEPIH